MFKGIWSSGIGTQTLTKGASEVTGMIPPQYSSVFANTPLDNMLAQHLWYAGRDALLIQMLTIDLACV